VAIAIIAALSYLLLGWEGLAATFVGLVSSVVVMTWLLVTGRMRWPPN
jgi:hypothetical protein